MALGSNSGLTDCFRGAALRFLVAGGWNSVPSEGRSGEKGIVCGAVENLVAGGGVAGLGATLGVGDGTAWGVGAGGACGMRWSSLGVNSTTLTVVGPAFLSSGANWVKKGKPAPIRVWRASDATIAIAVGSSKMSKKFLRSEDWYILTVNVNCQMCRLGDANPTKIDSQCHLYIRIRFPDTYSKLHHAIASRSPWCSMDTGRIATFFVIIIKTS